MAERVATRAEVVEAYAGSVTDPGRTTLRAAIIAQKKGRLHEAGLVVGDMLARDRATRSPSPEYRVRIEYAAVLLALDSAELRLAGSVSFTTPSRRPGSAQLDRFGPITMTVFPDEAKVGLGLVAPFGSAREYRLSSTPERLHLYAPAAEALTVLANELMVFLRTPVAV